MWMITKLHELEYELCICKQNVAYFLGMKVVLLLWKQAENKVSLKC